MDSTDPNFTDKVTEIIKGFLSNPAFSDRKITDTPTDALSVVNKNYVDGSNFYAVMYPSADQTIGTASSPYAIVNLDTVIISKGITCDTTNHKVIIQSAGVYHIETIGTYNNTFSSNAVEIPIFVNGTQRTALTTNITGVQQVTAVAEQLLSLNVGDYIEMRARSQGGNQTLFGNLLQTYILVFKI